MKVRLVVLAAVVGATLTGAAAASPAPPGPDASKMTLQASDFPGSKAQGARLAGAGLASGGYENVIRLATPFGASHYRLFDSIAIVGADVPSGIRLYKEFGHEFSSRANRVRLIASLLDQAGVRVDPKSISMLTPRGLGVQDSSMEVGFVVKVGPDRLNVSISLVRLDRVIDANLAIGSGSSVALADGQALTNISAGHIAAGLVPVGAEAPELTGTPASGQHLTVSAGTWEGAATTFSFQWQRCNAAGASCVDIPGATGVSYAVTPADSGSTLRANVTATGRFGSGTAPSGVSAVVP